MKSLLANQPGGGRALHVTAGVALFNECFFPGRRGSLTQNRHVSSFLVFLDELVVRSWAAMFFSSGVTISVPLS